MVSIPTIELGLGLVVQPLLRTDMSRAALVTFALNVSGVPSLAVAQDAVDDFSNNFLANMGGPLDAEVQMLPASIRLGDGSTTPFEATTTNSVATGGTAYTSASPQVAVLVKKNTGLGGKQNRGRTYMPWWVSTAYIAENGNLDSTAVANLQTDADTFLTQLTTDTIPMCIAHRVFTISGGKPVLTAYHTGPLVTSFKVESVVATQRRRVRS
jgi:lipoprotein-anchoring transpeptidase ErfK/SrfK